MALLFCWKLPGMVLCGGTVPVPGTGHNLLKAAKAAAKILKWRYRHSIDVVRERNSRGAKQS